MRRQESELFTIATLAQKWDTSENDVEHCLEKDKLKASVRLHGGVEMMRVVLEHDDRYAEMIATQTDSQSELAPQGMLDIVNYSNLQWEVDTVIQEEVTNLGYQKVFLQDPRTGIAYYVCHGYLIRKADIIIRSSEIDRGEDKPGDVCIHPAR